jgi:hypothetical protein
VRPRYVGKQADWCQGSSANVKQSGQGPKESVITQLHGLGDLFHVPQTSDAVQHFGGGGGGLRKRHLNT